MNKNKPVTTAKRIQRSAEAFIDLLRVRRDDEITAPHIKWSDTYLGILNNLEGALTAVVDASPVEISNINKQRRY